MDPTISDMASAIVAMRQVLPEHDEHVCRGEDTGVELTAWVAWTVSSITDSATARAVRALSPLPQWSIDSAEDTVFQIEGTREQILGAVALADKEA